MMICNSGTFASWHGSGNRCFRKLLKTGVLLKKVWWLHLRIEKGERYFPDPVAGINSLNNLAVNFNELARQGN
jgi:hypothetical protein